MTTPPEAGAEPPVEAPPEDEKESFGTWLRRQRELREISLREIADASKIGLRYLQALEEDRFDLLPALVFAKGFLRQYARYVGLDPEEAVNFFLDARGNSREKTAVKSAARPPRSLATSYGVAALAVALLLMLLVWGLLRLNQDGPATPEAPSTVTPPPPALVPPPPAVPREDDDVPPPEETVAPGPEATAGAPAPPALAAPVVVTLDFRGNCWVRAAVDGRYREARVYTQGESLQLEAERQVDLELGNVFDVAAEVNGRPFPLHEGSGPAVRRLTIDLETVAVLTASSAVEGAQSAER